MPAHDPSLTFRDFQRLIRDRYHATDAARGTPGTFLWLVEELGELATALQANAPGKTPTPEERANLGEEFADVFAWATGYHLASWLVVTLDGSRRSRRSRVRLLFASHAVPIGFAAACFAGDGPLLGALRTAFFAPAPYLFWSVAHVGHTLWRRQRRR